MPAVHIELVGFSEDDHGKVFRNPDMRSFKIFHEFVSQCTGKYQSCGVRANRKSMLDLFVFHGLEFCGKNVILRTQYA